jgi:uncharacterized membrane protein YraQ (UPF0718 family)
MAEVHSHSHSHAHDEDRSSYYLDQLFMIGVCGALAGVTIMLWQSGVLNTMLHQKFHIWVALGGISLLAIVFLRAVAIWRSVDEQEEPHEHGPGCSHDHGPEHHPGGGSGPTAVQPAPGGGGAALALVPAPTHSHAHSHSHSHSHGDGHDHGWAPWRYVVLLLPVVLYFLVLSQPSFGTDLTDRPSNPLEYIQNFIVIFRSILWEALPFIVLGALIAGLLEELLPQRFLASVLPRSHYAAIALGGLLGLVFPMCECGIIPIMRRLLRKGLPLSCCIAYLLAGPIVNVVVLLSTFAAFSGMENVYVDGQPSYQMGAVWMTLFRAGLGYIVAVVTALVVEWQYRKHGDALLTPLARRGPVEEDNGEPRSLWQRVSNVTEVALHDFVDITVFLILGALLAASVRMFLSPEQVGQYSQEYWPLAILAMMGLAVALCLCSEADAFVAASFVTLRPSAKVAFLVLGPMLDFKLYAMYTRIFRPRLILVIYASVLTQVFVYSTATHLFWDGLKWEDRVIIPAFGPMLVHPTPPKKETIKEEDLVDQAGRAGLLVGLAGTPVPGGTHLADFVTGWARLTTETEAKVPEIGFQALENAALSPEMRSYYEGRPAMMTGQFSGSDRHIELLRYKINCCLADATKLKAVILVDQASKQTLNANKLKGLWVSVTGRLHFYQTGPNAGNWIPALIIYPTTDKPLEKLVKVIQRPDDPFLN